MSAADREARALDAVYREFGQAGVLSPAGGGPDLAVRVILERPREAAVLDRSSISLERPTVRVPLSDAPALRRGDRLAVDGKAWTLAEAPLRPGTGQEWRAAVEGGGPAA